MELFCLSTWLQSPFNILSNKIFDHNIDTNLQIIYSIFKHNILRKIHVTNEE